MLMEKIKRPGLFLCGFCPTLATDPLVFLADEENPASEVYDCSGCGKLTPPMEYRDPREVEMERATSGRFRKRPVVVDAFRFRSSRIPGWMDDVERKWELSSSGSRLLIRTLEGTVEARRGDWVIRGVEGEIYPCKHEIFVKTYEREGNDGEG